MTEVIEQLKEKEASDRFMMNVQRDVLQESERYSLQKRRFDRLLEDGFKITKSALVSYNSGAPCKNGDKSAKTTTSKSSSFIFRNRHQSKS